MFLPNHTASSFLYIDKNSSEWIFIHMRQVAAHFWLLHWSKDAVKIIFSVNSIDLEAPIVKLSPLCTVQAEVSVVTGRAYTTAYGK